MKPKLVRIDDAQRGHSPFRLIAPLFEGELKLHAGSLEEIQRASANPNMLISRHGLGRVVAFYREQLLPGLSRLPRNETWSARYEVSWQLLQMLQASGDHRPALDLTLSLVEDLPRARFSKSGREEAGVHDELRRALAAPLAQLIPHLKQGGMMAEVVTAYEALNRLGRLDKLAPSGGVGLPDYAELLWGAGDTRTRTLPLYIRYLALHGWRTNGHGRLKEMTEYVRGRLAIDERMPREELSERMWLNQMALCASGPVVAARNVGLGYLLLGQPDRALAYLRRAQPRDGGQDGAALFYLGRALYLTGARAEAEEAFELAAAAGVSRTRLAGWLGLALARDGLRDESAELFREAEGQLAASPDNDFYLQWGRACFLSGELDEAERRFRQAVERGGGWRAGLGQLACLERGGQRAAAAELLRRLSADAPEAAPPAYLIGRLLQSEGRLHDAVECYGRAVKLCPHDAEYRFSLGLALDDLGDAGALLHLERAAEVGAGGPEVVRRVVLKHAQDGKWGAFRYWLKRLASACPDSEPVRRFHARSLASQATEAFNAEKFGEAGRLWEETDSAIGDDARVRERLAAALLYDAAARLKGSSDAAVWMQVEKAYELVRSPEAELLYAAGRMAHGDFGDARRRLTTLARELPGVAECQPLADLAALLSVENELLADCAGGAVAANDPLREVVEGMRSALHDYVKEALPPLAPAARLPDDLALPPPLPPFEPAFEPLEKTVLRDS